MSDVIQQDDLMTQLFASHPQVGRLLWFTVEDGPVDQHTWLQAMVQAGLASYGIPAGIPATTAYLRGLRAMQHAAGGRTHLRRVERERGRTVHHWIRETVAGGQVEFRVLAAIERRTDRRTVQDILNTHRLTALHGAEDAAFTRLQDFVDTAGHTYTPGDRRRQVRRWLDHVGALHLAAAGPMRFVPEPATGLIESLHQAQDALGVHVWSMPLARSGDVIATLTHSLDAEVTQKTAALLHSVQAARAAGKTPTVGQQAKLVEQLRTLDDRVQRYAGLFGEQLDNLTSQIAIAKQAVRGALAE